MDNYQAALVKDSSLGCFLKHWKDLKLDDLRPKQMVFFYNLAWPRYKLGDQEVWSKDGSLNYDAILQLIFAVPALANGLKFLMSRPSFSSSKTPKCGPLDACYY